MVTDGLFDVSVLLTTAFMMDVMSSLGLCHLMPLSWAQTSHLTDENT